MSEELHRGELELGGGRGAVLNYPLSTHHFRHSLPFFLISMFRRLIFWLRVESGTRNWSAASVWFQPLFSSMSVIMRRSQSSMISNNDASGRCSLNASLPR